MNFFEVKSNSPIVFQPVFDPETKEIKFFFTVKEGEPGKGEQIAEDINGFDIVGLVEIPYMVGSHWQGDECEDGEDKETCWASYEAHFKIFFVLAGDPMKLQHLATVIQVSYGPDGAWASGCRHEEQDAQELLIQESQKRIAELKEVNLESMNLSEILKKANIIRQEHYPYGVTSENLPTCFKMLYAAA